MGSNEREAALPAEDQAPILEAGRNCGAIHPADRMAMLVDGECYFNALTEVIERAERVLCFACWDIDSRIILKRDAKGKGKPLRLFLEEIVTKKPALHIYFLSWDFAMIYTFEREHLPLFKQKYF